VGYTFFARAGIRSAVDLNQINSRRVAHNEVKYRAGGVRPSRNFQNFFLANRFRQMPDVDVIFSIRWVDSFGVDSFWGDFFTQLIRPFEGDVNFRMRNQDKARHHTRLRPEYSRDQAPLSGPHDPDVPDRPTFTKLPTKTPRGQRSLHAEFGVLR